MSEQSYLFDFARVDSFLENINIGFTFDEMWKVTGESDGEYTYEETGSDCFELVVCTSGGNNINDYLDENGFFDPSTVASTLIQSCSLDYYNKGYGEATIELHDEVLFDIGYQNINVKAILLRNISTGYVLGYSINQVPVPVTNKIIFDDDVIFWDISRFNYNG